MIGVRDGSAKEGFLYALFLNVGANVGSIFRVIRVVITIAINFLETNT